jgi:hypothetical protein
LVDGQDSSNKENVDPNKTDDWLHRNDSLDANNIDEILISNRMAGNKIVVHMESTPTLLCCVALYTTRGSLMDILCVLFAFLLS